MPRIARQDLQTTFYHIMVQGIDRESIFESKENKTEYIKRIENQKIKEVKIYSYCVMSNHAHFLVYVEKITDLSLMMKRINTSYAAYYNRKTNRAGYVFRNRYRSQGIFDERYLISCMVYIHNNPVKAGFIKNIKDYDYSSYNEYLKSESKITDIKSFCTLMGLATKDLVELHNKDYGEQWINGKLIQTYDDVCVEFMKEHKISEIKEIIANKELMKVFAEKINKETGISMRMIAQKLCVNRETLRKVVMSNYTSP